MSNSTEAVARIKINKLLEDAGWRLLDTKNHKANVDLEYSTKIIREDNLQKQALLDYLLLDSHGYPLCVLEAKREKINPLFAKAQARKYALSQKIRFIILSNGNIHYLWDIQTGNPEIITSMPTQLSLEQRINFNPDTKALHKEEIIPEYVALMQNPNLLQEPNYLDETKKQKFIEDNNYRILRDYQINAIKALQLSAKEGNSRFLFEMATGTGKTLISAGIIKLFLKTANATRVLFLVDRIELEQQAETNFKDYLKDYTTVIYKESKQNWRKAEIVVTTIQSLLVNDRYKTAFSPTDFDLLISDEAHRCIGGNARSVFEYFVGYKLGLTATPKDYLKGVNSDLLKFTDSRELEKRILLDTYKTFGCENAEPTFRYSLMDGVKDGYLINPITADVRTEITTQLLSDKGYKAVYITEDGKTEEELVFHKQFEKKFFSEKTNIEFCKALLTNGLKDPVSGEFGKTIVFCVSQTHAAKITQILNKMAHSIWKDKYNSDFAEQITSNVADSQTMTVNFANNNLNFNSKFIEGYNTSKTRVCVTVGMMTTGYDCRDILNLALMRPIFSPTDFVQIKGRGTRKYNFKFTNVDKQTTIIPKKNFKLFDFFANCEYFEKKFNYDERIEVQKDSGKGGKGYHPPIESKTIEVFELDKIKTHIETPIGFEGMKIDRELFKKTAKSFTSDTELIATIENKDWAKAETIVKEKYENKPELYITLEKLAQSEKLDRPLTWVEVIQKAFKLITKFKNQDELLEDECQKFISIYKPDPEYIDYIRNFIKAYIVDEEFRAIINNDEIQKLNFYQGFTFEEWKELGTYSKELPQYIINNINIKKFIK